MSAFASSRTWSQRWGERTGIELAAVRLESALVVDLDLVALLRLPLALNRQGHVDLEVSRQHTDGGGSQKRKGQERKLHLG